MPRPARTLRRPFPIARWLCALVFGGASLSVGGAPLFAPGKTHNLTLDSTRQHGGGIMELNYTIKD